ncbi:hypothetical protein CDCA_CDCA07G2212 [Cyanidium caldarium]|uniref:5-formyltetrahydrofolate cyclo-ligase n=1 Tax=Cyanidium caldarium TaxID=2771 RepID=A0AAV9IV23_CYACA|nr:hypothetical protein CDCA_CDCA07G2212 [Cyanidium caldarium]
MADTMVIKRELRKRIRAALKALPTDELVQRSSTACRKLILSDSFQRARTVALFHHMPSGELHTTELIKQCFALRKRVFLPKVEGGPSSRMEMYEAVDADDLARWPRGVFDIPDPPAAATRTDVEQLVQREQCPLDVIVVPGLAFDLQGGRLGRGKGYYDHFLRRCDALHRQHGMPLPSRVGLALACQIVDCVPMAEHDQRVHELYYA